MLANTPPGLDLIQQMINNARKDFKDNGIMFLLWGWLIFVCALSSYVLLYFDSPYANYPWMLTPLGSIASIVLMRRENRQRRVKTWVDKVLKYTWISVCAGIFISLVAMPVAGLATYPMLMMCYGIGTFITGGALDFNPLKYGAVAAWLLALAALFAPLQEQLLLLAASLLLAYIIPGHILFRNYYKNDETTRSHSALTATPGGHFAADDRG